MTSLMMGRSLLMMTALFLLVNCPADVLANGAGAPDRMHSCIRLFPQGHGESAQGTPSPYAITLSSDHYDPDMDIDVTISSGGSEVFKGFILQTRTANPALDQNQTYGYFTEDGGGRGQHNCPSYHNAGASITHTSTHSGNPINSITFTWTAPDAYMGHLEFRATVVQEFRTFWTDIVSDVLTDPTAGTLPPDVTDVDSSDIPETEQPPPAVPTGTVPEIDLTQCGVSKGCYRYPEGCDQLECDYLLTWQLEGDSHTVDFEISVKLTEGDNWAAVGMSYDILMGDDSVVDCRHDASSDQVVVQMSFNEEGAKHNEPLNNKLLGLVPDSLEGFYAGGYIMCRFTRVVSINSTQPVLLNDFEKVFNLDEEYHLFLGRGPVAGDTKLRHSETPRISRDKVTLASDQYVDIGGGINYPLIQAHGSLMVFAWMVFASFGVLMPRYFKPAWPEKTFFGKAIWFQIHQPCMIFVVLLTITAFVIIFVEVGGYAEYDDLPSAAHPPLGITVTILAILNPIGGLLRPAPNAKFRPIFNWAHFLGGQLAHILAAATIFIACYMDKARLPDYTQWVVTAFICWHVLIEIILAAHMHWLKTQGASLQVTLPAANGTSKLKDPSGISSSDHVLAVAKPPPGSKFKTTVVCLHLLGVLGLGITMVVAICTV